ncbi:transposase, Mutator family protein [Mycobacterium xenopi 3993]|nr:transposase, Mutator family protein [Mycobacterium xenopi 3993]
MAATPKSSWPWVRTLLHSVFDQPDAESVVAQYDRVLDALSDKLPKWPNTSTQPARICWRSPLFPNRSGAKSGATIPYPLTGPGRTRATQRREIQTSRPEWVDAEGRSVMEGRTCNGGAGAQGRRRLSDRR